MDRLRGKGFVCLGSRGTGVLPPLETPAEGVVWYGPVCEGGHRFVAAWAREKKRGDDIRQPADKERRGGTGKI